MPKPPRVDAGRASKFRKGNRGPLTRSPPSCTGGPRAAVPEPSASVDTTPGAEIRASLRPRSGSPGPAPSTSHLDLFAFCGCDAAQLLSYWRTPYAQRNPQTFLAFVPVGGPRCAPPPPPPAPPRYGLRFWKALQLQECLTTTLTVFRFRAVDSWVPKRLRAAHVDTAAALIAEKGTRGSLTRFVLLHSPCGSLEVIVAHTQPVGRGMPFLDGGLNGLDGTKTVMCYCVGPTGAQLSALSPSSAQSIIVSCGWDHGLGRKLETSDYFDSVQLRADAAKSLGVWVWVWTGQFVAAYCK